MTTDTQPVARAVDADLIVKEILDLGVEFIVIVPDSVQKAMIEKIQAEPKVRTLTVTCEDDAMAVHTGLHAGGVRSIIMMQNNGILASVNTMKAFPLNSQIPTFIFVGQFGRDVTKRVEDNSNRAVNLLEPTLDTWSVPHYRLEGPEDISNIRKAYEKAMETNGPAALIIGAPTK